MGNLFGIQLQYSPRRTSFGMVLSCKDAHEIAVGWAWGDWVKPGLFKKRDTFPENLVVRYQP